MLRDFGGGEGDFAEGLDGVSVELLEVSTDPSLLVYDNERLGYHNRVCSVL